VSLQRWFAPLAPSVGIEIGRTRVTVAAVGRPGRTLTTYAVEGVPEGAVTPALTGVNIAQPDIVQQAVARALDRAGQRSVRRVALVVPDGIARVSLLTFDQAPARAQDLDRLVDWQVRKAAAVPADSAVVAHFPAAREGARLTVAAVVTRRDVLTQYEAVVGALGLHAGLVDLASFNVINAALATEQPDGGDWLLVHLAGDGATLAILRGTALMFYRHRTVTGDEPLSSLVHQTAMYHEDRLGASEFSRVLLSGAGIRHDEVRRELGTRLNVPVVPIDVRSVAAAPDGLSAAGADLLDALAASVGVLVREPQTSHP
jgi:Tfp pilus assembly PilM family ATPase